MPHTDGEGGRLQAYINVATHCTCKWWHLVWGVSSKI